MKAYRPGLAIVLAIAVVAIAAIAIAAIGSGPGADVSATSTPDGIAAVTSPPGGVPAATPAGVAQGSAQPATSPIPTPTPTPTPTPEPTPGTDPGSTHPSLAHLIGQKLVIVMGGHTPSADLLGRIRRGEVGGICLLARNITTRSALIALTRKLQAAATAGGQPPLLIAVDQEGGSVKRIPWAPPTLTVPEMGSINSTAVARAQGAKTGAALIALGINADFAPVVDVPRTSASFMYQQGRVFGFNATRTAALADAFAAGLKSKGVLATMKHFPGIGLATKNSDHYVDTITATKAILAADLLPYKKAIGHDLAMVMLSNVTYTAYDPSHAAGWSNAIAVKLLRQDLGFNGITITDSLNGTAHARGLTVKVLAFRAAIAGTDMILVTSSEISSRALYVSLLAEATDGSIPMATLRTSYDRILAVKAGL